MWIADLNLGETYLLHGKPVVLVQTRTLTRVEPQLDEHSCIVHDPVTHRYIHCQPHELQEAPHGA